MNVGTTLPKIALAFAKECMGWAECRPSKLYKPSIMGYPTSARDGRERFACDDLNSVVDAVMEWCAEHDDMGFVVHFTRRGLWTAIIQRECVIPPEPMSEEYPEGEGDLCHALMSACLEAARELKARAA